MGVGVGLAYPAARRIVILADPDHLGQNLGRMLAADVAGFAVGPAISAVLVGPFGIAAPFLLIAGLTVAMYPLIARARVAETDVEAEMPPRFAFDLLRIRPYLGSAVDGRRRVHDDRHLRRAVGAGARRPERQRPRSPTSASPCSRCRWCCSPRSVDGLRRPSGRSVSARSVCWSARRRCSPTVTHRPVESCWRSRWCTPPTTASPSAVAESRSGMVVPAERQASAQGLLGGVETLTAGITATAIGQIYEHFGHTVAYTSCAVVMVALIICGAVLSGTRGGCATPLSARSPRPRCRSDYTSASPDMVLDEPNRVLGTRRLIDCRSGSSVPAATRPLCCANGTPRRQGRDHHRCG